MSHLAVLEDVPLAPRTTLSAGGGARFFAEARTAEEVREALEWAHRRLLPVQSWRDGARLAMDRIDERYLK